MNSLTESTTETTPYNASNFTEVPEVHPTGLTNFVPSEALVSNEVREMLEYMVDFSLISVVCLIGAFTNAVAIAIFYRQGYNDTINISLTSIAFWDIIKCICGFMYRTRGIARHFSPAFSFTYETIVLFVFANPSFYCTPVTSALAAYVAVERCLCVSLPFTVKYLLTRKVVTIVMVALSIISFSSLAVTYAARRIVWVYSSKFDAVIATEVYADPSTTDAFNNYYSVVLMVWVVASLVLQSICTVIITYHLNKASKFRSQSSNAVVASTDVNKQKDDSEKNAKMSSRDKHVTKMLLVIIVFNIAALLPTVISAIGKLAEPEFYVFRRYHNFFITRFYFLSLCEFLNAAANPFVYYVMSSSFKNTFHSIFGRNKMK